MIKRQLKSGLDKYHVTTKQEREYTIVMRQLGQKSIEIAQELGICDKTVQSIQSVERADKNSLFKMHIQRDYLKIFIDNQKLIGLGEKQQKRLIRKIIKSEFIYETSQYQFYLKHNKTSKRKRILESVVNEIQKGFQQHLLQKINQDCLEFHDDFVNQHEQTSQFNFMDFIECNFQFE